MKQELRKKFIIERNKLIDEYRDYASTKILSTIETNELFKSATKIFIFVGFGSEIATIPFIKKWINKKQIFVPKIDNNTMNIVIILPVILT